MATALTRYHPQTREYDSTFTSLDAKSLACSSDGQTVFTSPNMDFVPEPHFGDEVLQARADGRFGPVDCFQWPQLYATEWRFSVCIPRRENHPNSQSLHWAWFTPEPDDLRPSPGAPEGYGFLKDEKMIGLDSLFYQASKRHAPWKAKRGNKPDIATQWLKDLQHTITVLRNLPLPLVDVIGWVAFAQRTFLDIYSFMEFVEVIQPRLSDPSVIPYPVCKHWMGCFTSDPSLCNDLFLAGVPVWYIRDKSSINNRVIIEKSVKFAFPDAICRALYSEPGKSTVPYPRLHCGPGGLQRHNHTRTRYIAFSADPLQSASSRVGKTPTNARMKNQSKKGTEVRGPLNPKPATTTAPWKDVLHSYMPGTFQIWTLALQRVASLPVQPAKPAHSVDACYHVPDPSLLFGSLTAEKRRRYIINWLVILPNWLDQIGDDPSQKLPTMAMWRCLLNSGPSSELKEMSSVLSRAPTKASRLKSVVLEVFGPACTTFTLGGETPPKDSVQWHNRDIEFATLSDPPPRLIRAILWEVYELGFMFELRALDQAVVPHLWQAFPMARKDALDGMFPKQFWRATLPDSPGSLGLTDRPIDNSDMLGRFRFFLAGWPDAPSAFSAISVGLSGDRLRAWEFEQSSRVAMFYVTTFYKYFDRAPLLPHQFPPEYF